MDENLYSEIADKYLETITLYGTKQIDMGELIKRMSKLRLKYRKNFSDTVTQIAINGHKKYKE